jgi:uncharacterized protein (DUF1697 family)
LATTICLIRGVNVGGHGKLEMAALRRLFANLGFGNVQTLLQSGNVVFDSGRVKPGAIVWMIAGAIEKNFALKPDIILRTPAEMQRAVDANPFPAMAEKDPSHLLIHFLSGRVDKSASAKLDALARPPEKFAFGERELYIHYANGVAGSKLGGPAMDRALGARGTARNWNTIRKLLELAERL